MYEELGKLQCSLSEGELNRSTNSSARNFATCFPRFSARYPQTQQRAPPRTRLFSKYFVNQFSLQNKFLFWQATFQKPREGKLVKQTTSFKKKKKNNHHQQNQTPPSDTSHGGKKKKISDQNGAIHSLHAEILTTTKKTSSKEKRKSSYKANNSKLRKRQD